MKLCRIAAFAFIASCVIPWCAVARASDASKQSDVFKSIQDSMGPQQHSNEQHAGD